MMSDRVGFKGEEIMFSSNATPAEDFIEARRLGAIINLDDFTHIDFLEKVTGSIPETICCRYNPGGDFRISTQIMGSPSEAKYGMTDEQILRGLPNPAKGAKRFGIHAFRATTRTMSIIRHSPECFLSLRSE